MRKAVSTVRTEIRLWPEAAFSLALLFPVCPVWRYMKSVVICLILLYFIKIALPLTSV